MKAGGVVIGKMVEAEVNRLPIFVVCILGVGGCFKELSPWPRMAPILVGATRC